VDGFARDLTEALHEYHAASAAPLPSPVVESRLPS